MPKQILSLDEAGRPVDDAALRDRQMGGAPDGDEGRAEDDAKTAEHLSSFTGLSATAATRRPMPGEQERRVEGASSMSPLRRPLELGELRLRRPAEEMVDHGGSALDEALRVPVLSPQQAAAVAEARERGEDDDQGQPRPPVQPQDVALIPRLGGEQRCGACGGPLVRVGWRAERRLEVIHYRFEDLQLDRAVLDCPAGCLERPVLAPEPVFAAGTLEAGDGLLARAVVARWRDQISYEAQCMVWGQVGAVFGYKRLGRTIQGYSARAAAFVGEVERAPRRDGRWGRVRRLFIEALPTWPQGAAEALARLERLECASGRGDPGSELASIRTWLTAERAGFVEPRGALQVAVRSFSDLWDVLVTDLSGEGDGPDLPGRAPEDWEGGEDEARVWTGLIETCRGLGVDPWVYLRDLFTDLARDGAGWSPSAWIDWRRAQGRPVV